MATTEPVALVQLKAREAQLRAQLAVLEVEKAKMLATRRLNIGIVGFGRFGRFLATAFKRNGHEIAVLSRSDYSAQAEELGATSYHSLADNEDVAAFVAKDLDVIVLATSILSFDALLSRFSTFLAAGLSQKLQQQQQQQQPGEEYGYKAAPRAPLIVDVLSVKEHPREIMLATLPASCSVLCTHPMFGPESGRHGWAGLKFVYEKARVHAADVENCERFLSIFESEGCKMVELSCRQHDVYAANSQFLTHLVGRMLGSTTGLELRRTPIDTKGFESVLQLVETTCGDSFDLFYGLYRYNANSKSTLLSVRKALADLELQLINLEQSERAEDGDHGKK